METTVLVPPDGEPVSLAAVKEYLRIGHDGEDSLIASLIGSARARLEVELGAALVTRTVKIAFESWPRAVTRTGIRLEPGPVRDVLDVVSVSPNGARETITSRFVLSGGRLCVRPWSFIPAIEALSLIHI